jgi:hypothetical protein
MASSPKVRSESNRASGIAGAPYANRNMATKPANNSVTKLMSPKAKHAAGRLSSPPASRSRSHTPAPKIIHSDTPPALRTIAAGNAD